MADEKYKMKASIEVTGDQGHVHRAHAEYENMGYAAMHSPQSAVVAALVGLGDAKVSASAKAK